MKKAEAISILAASVRPREAKGRARYDEAVRMAIEALKCSETPNNSERAAENAQDVQNVDLISKLSEIRSNYNCFGADEEPYYRALSEAIRILSQLADDDTISRKAAIEALRKCQAYLFDEHDPDKKISLESAELAIEDLPPSAPSTAQTTETTADTTAPTTDGWIPVERELPDDLTEVNVTWVNPFTKSKPFTASAVYYEGKWYWYSSICVDVLGEYGQNDMDKVDDMIEITAWRPLPEPYRGGDE